MSRKKKIDRAVDDVECPVQCGCNAHAAPGFFSLAGTAVKASGTDAQLDAAGSVLWAVSYTHLTLPTNSRV